MINLTKDIQSLTDFKRNTAEFMRQLKSTGHPLVLTVNGKAELVVQDAESYQKVLDLIERAQAIAGIRRGLEEVGSGRTKSADQVFEEMRQKFNISRDG